MEEKKLNDTDIGFGMTDEAIIETLKELAIKKSKDSYVYRVLANSLDLIHRLQDDYSKLKEKYVKVLSLNEKVIAEQKAEIERLTKRLELADKDNDNLAKTIFDYEKQVDELKTVKADYLKNVIEKTEKDTAKEILQELSDFVDFETFREGFELVKVKRKIKDIAKEKGVEVE